MLSITPVRDRISERFPVASFVVNAPPDRYFEIACATDPQLFRPDHQHRRTERNFATSRVGGLLRAPAGQATYIIPPQQLRQFAGARRIYYAAAAFRGARHDDPVLTLSADRIEQAPSIQLSPDFTGRSLDRGRLEPASARYGAAATPPPGAMSWGGDLVLPAGGARVGSPAPISGDRGAAPAPAVGAGAALAYDDGFDPALWETGASAEAREDGDDGDEPSGYEDAPAYGAATVEPPGFEDAPGWLRAGAPAAPGSTRAAPRPAPHRPPPAPPAPSAAAYGGWSAPPPMDPRAAPSSLRYGGGAAAPPRPASAPAALPALHHERYGSAGAAPLRAPYPPTAAPAGDSFAFGGDTPGFEDVPDLVRNLGPRYRAFGGPAFALEGEPAALPPAAPPVSTPPAAPAASAETSARFADFSDDLAAAEPLPEVALALADDDEFTPDDPRHRVRIIHRVAVAESGRDGYAALNPDREFDDPSLPEFYQRKHVGLSWGLVQFAQRYGGLGFALTICNRRDPEAFAQVFGAHHAAPASEALPPELPSGHLLRVTNAADEDARLAPVVPPAGGAAVELWREPWLRAFAEAGAIVAFQEAQREAADRRYYAPYLDVLAAIGLSSPRAHAMFVDRSLHMGGGAALRWILRTIGPIRSQELLRAALAFLGHADLRSFQRSAALPADGQFGPLSHAAMIRALRASTGSPITVPGEDTMLTALVDEAERQAAVSPSRIWRLTAQRLRALRDDPNLARVPPEPSPPSPPSQQEQR